MQLYDSFLEQLHAAMNKERIVGKHSYLYCRDNWGVKEHYMKKGLSDIEVRTYFRYCNDTGCCPAETIVLLLKDVMDPLQLIANIEKIYGIEHEN